jgi:RNA polymerase sigma-70 factor (ECF subfamily)
VTVPLDESLATRIRSGSADALEELYRAVGARLLALAWRLTQGRADAEDVVHDVFVGLPRALAGYRDRGSFSAWLQRLVVRTALMRRRGEGRRAARDSAYAVDLERDGSGVDAATGDDADRILSTLPDSLRVVVVLREIEGMSHRDVAKALGISEAASRVRLVRGMERLRRLLREEG